MSMAVVIINYNTREHLRACLATVQSEGPCELIVVDNASSDGSVEMVQSEYPWVDLQVNKNNVGYGAAANQAIARCTTDYVLLLNADILLQPGALQSLSTYLDQHPRVAIVGPRLVNPDGTLQSSCYPFPGTLQWLFDNNFSSRLVRHISFLRHYLLRSWLHTEMRIVPAVKGAALAIRRKAFETVSGFDQSFFLYFEELDLCYRLIAAGWQIHFAPVTTVVHIGGASTMQYPSDMAVQLSTSLMQFLHRHYAGIRLIGSILVVKNLERIKLIYETILFHLTSNAAKRSTLAEHIAARKRILYEAWRKEVTPDQISNTSSELTYNNRK